MNWPSLIKGIVLGVFACVFVLVWQNCSGGSTAGDPFTSQPETEVVASKFSDFDAYPFEDDDEILPGDPVTPHIVSLRVCVRGFIVNLGPNERYHLSDLATLVDVEPSGTPIGLFTRTPLALGEYQGFYGFHRDCGTPFSIQLENSYGSFSDTELLPYPSSLTKTEDEYGNEFWVIPMQPLVDDLVHVQSSQELRCVFLPERCP